MASNWMVLKTIRCWWAWNCSDATFMLHIFGLHENSTENSSLFDPSWNQFNEKKNAISAERCREREKEIEEMILDHEHLTLVLFIELMACYYIQFSKSSVNATTEERNSLYNWTHTNIKWLWSIWCRMPFSHFSWGDNFLLCHKSIKKFRSWNFIYSFFVCNYHNFIVKLL